MKCLQSLLLLLLVVYPTWKVYGQLEFDPEVNKGPQKRKRSASTNTLSYDKQTHSFFVGMNWNATFEETTPNLYDLDPFHGHPLVPYPIGYLFMNEPAHYKLFPAPELGYTYQLRNDTRGMCR